MANQDSTGAGQEDLDGEALSPLVKAYVDQQIKGAIERQDASQSKKKKWVNSWRSTSPITKASLVLNAFVALTTLLYTIAAWRTMTVMRQISNDNSQQTARLIDATTQIKNAGWIFSGAAIGINNAGWNAVGKLQEQAARTESLANTARNSLVAQQRAFLYAVPIAETVSSADGRAFLEARVGVRWENSGLGPARHVITHISHKPLAGIPAHFNYPEIMENDPLERYMDSDPVTFVAPRGQLSRSTRIPLTQNDLLVMSYPGLIREYYWGYAKYHDIFSDSVSTSLNFASVSRGMKKLWPGARTPELKGPWSSCAHNTIATTMNAK